MPTLPNPQVLLRALVASPSVSSTDSAFDQSNAGVVDLLAQWLDDLGFVVSLQPLKADPTKVNLVAKLGDGPGGLALFGHTDTVPFDETKWQSDPFELREVDGALYGLGAADMKAFFPIRAQSSGRVFRKRPDCPAVHRRDRRRRKHDGRCT